MPPLDIENVPALLEYLRLHGRIGPAEQVRLTRLEGGVSNRTVLVERNSGQAWVLKQALSKLRVAVDWYSPPERAEREAAGLRWLATLAPAGTITPLAFEDAEQHVVAMEAVPQPHRNWKSLLLAGCVEPAHFRQFGELLAAIHRGGYQRREELQSVFDDRSYFESLRLEPYYRYSAEQVPEARKFLERLIAATLACRITVVHGDYSPKNVLIRNGRMVLLDHEVIHFGDPAFDLGFSMAHFLSKAHHLPPLRSAFAAAAGEYWLAYRDGLGAPPWLEELEQRAVRHTLGCLLARVAGRSRLEYLDETERARQREVVLELMAAPPDAMPHCIAEFTRRLDTCRSSNA